MTRERFLKEAKLGDKLSLLMRKYRLMGRARDVIPIAPPLCIKKEEVDHLVMQLSQIIGEVKRMV